jgi:sulfonate transport system substrate-binding protein
MKLRLGGVPEHFNYMWHLPAAREVMRSYGIYYEWTDFPGGTGAMSEALETDQIDMAIMLTEGAIAAVANGKDFQILFPFVMSPLLWGVFAKNSRRSAIPDSYANSRFAISRYQSGSHLMAMFLAQRENAVLNDTNFVLCQNLQGAREKLAAEEADFFLWEKYMTRPLVHSGEFLEVGEVSAPWPSFVFVCKRRSDLLEKETWKQAVYELTSDYLVESKAEILNGICNAFSLHRGDAEAWLEEVKYYDNNDYWQDRITAAVIIMHSKNMIQRQPVLNELL